MAGARVAESTSLIAALRYFLMVLAICDSQFFQKHASFFLIAKSGAINARTDRKMHRTKWRTLGKLDYFIF